MGQTVLRIFLACLYIWGLSRVTSFATWSLNQQSDLQVAIGYGTVGAITFTVIMGFVWLVKTLEIKDEPKGKVNSDDSK